jgi:general secretion pathway protein I
VNEVIGIRNDKGISLVEVLVAFVILAMAVSVLLRIFSSGTVNIVISQQYVDAVQIAESQLASIGVDKELIPATETGSSGDRYNWQTTIEPYNFYEDKEQEIYPVSAFRIMVEVSWLERGHTRRIELSSIKLKQNTITTHSG